MAWTKILKSGDIVNADLTGSAGITGANIASDTIDSAHYKDNSIDEAHIADDAVYFIDHLKAGTDGELITWDASGNPAAVAVGTNDHILTSNGSGAAPTFQAAGTIATRATLDLDTDDSPEFAALNVGSAGDTTLTGSSGSLLVEGKVVYTQGGSDVAVVDGGTGSSSAPMIGVVTAGNASAARTVLGVDVAGTDNSDDNANSTGSAAVATTVTLTDEGSDTTCFPVFAQSATGNIAMETDSVFTYNASNGSLGATTFVGALTGLASTATTAAACSGNTAGSALTVTQAAQTAITSVGTLTGLTVSATIAGSVNGSAATVATIAGLAPNTATTQATQGNITSAANLATIGTIGTGEWRGTVVSTTYGGTGVSSMGALKNALDDETWTFANAVEVPALTVTGNLNVTGVTTTIDSANLAITDAVIQLNVLADQTDYTTGDSAIIFGHTTNASGGKIINDASTGFKFTELTAADDPKDGTIVGEGTAGIGTYVDIYSKGIVLTAQTGGAPTEVEGMLYWSGSDLYVGNPS